MSGYVVVISWAVPISDGSISEIIKRTAVCVSHRELASDFARLWGEKNNVSSYSYEVIEIEKV